MWAHSVYWGIVVDLSAPTHQQKSDLFMNQGGSGVTRVFGAQKSKGCMHMIAPGECWRCQRFGAEYKRGAAAAQLTGPLER